MDFLIIGAAKSGTSSLWALVRDHPDVWMPLPKELPYFSGPDYQHGWNEFARRNLRGAPQDAKIGKATPGYMAGTPKGGVARDDPEREIPERIARLFPDIKLIAILRDPVERALSGYAMARSTGGESRDPDTAFDELLRPEALLEARRNPHRLRRYVVLGEYGRILRGYLDVFDSSQLLTLSTAQLAADPEAVLASVWRFIGVEDHTPANLHTRYMVSADLTRRHGYLMGVADGPLIRAVRKAARALPPAIRDPLRQRFWARAERSVISANDERQPEPAGPRHDLSPELRERLVAHYEPDSAELEKLIGWSPLREAGPGTSAPATSTGRP